MLDATYRALKVILKTIDFLLILYLSNVDENNLCDYIILFLVE